MKSTTRINAVMAALAIALLGVGCAPSPDVLRAGAGRESWSPASTRSPAALDAAAPDPGGDDPEPPPPGEIPRVDAGVRGPGAADASVSSSPGSVDAAPSSPVVIPTGPAAKCQLTFQVTTVTYGGDYSPRNVGAIWVSDAKGAFVKSLNVWGRRRLRHLNTWENASGGNVVDAITAATATGHGARMGTWDCTDVTGKPVPNGSYSINAEFTESNADGHIMKPVPMVQGAGAVEVSPPDQASFKAAHLKVTP
jgi:hypothetical protein